MSLRLGSWESRLLRSLRLRSWRKQQAVRPAARARATPGAAAPRRAGQGGWRCPHLEWPPGHPGTPRPKPRAEPCANPMSQEVGSALHSPLGCGRPRYRSLHPAPRPPFCGAQVPHFLFQRLCLLGRSSLGLARPSAPSLFIFVLGNPGEAEPCAWGHTAREREASPLPPGLQTIPGASVARGSWLTHRASWAEEQHLCEGPGPWGAGTPSRQVLPPHPGRCCQEWLCEALPSASCVPARECGSPAKRR